MKKLLKTVLTTLAVLVLLLVVVVLALPFMIDPNSFKGALTQAAARQNLSLELTGPLGWQFYPRLGLSLEGLQVAPLDTPDEPLLQAESGSAVVALRPLFSRKVMVDELVLQGLAVNLQVDDQGRGNWEGIGADEERPTEQQTGDGEGSGESSFELAVERIALEDGSFRYRDLQSGDSYELSDFKLELQDVNLQQRAFPFNVEGMLRLSQLPEPLQLALEGEVEANNSLDNFAADGTLTVQAGNQSLASDFAINLGLAPALSYEGQLALQAFSPRAFMTALGQSLPTMQDSSALGKLALEAQFSGSDNALAAEKLALTLDDTQFDGRLRLSLPANGRPAISLAMKGGQINLDRYLPPEEEAAAAEQQPKQQAPANQTAGTGQTRPTESGAPTPLPLNALRGTDAELQFSLDQVQVQGMTVSQPILALTGEAGLWTLDELSANLYQGRLQGSASLDARESRGGVAALQSDFRLEGLSVQPLLMDFAEFGELSGTVNGRLSAQSQGSNDEALFENLSAAFEFTSPALTFQGVNAEYFYCQMATQIGDGEMPQQQWPRRTQITSVEGRLGFDDQRLGIERFVANVENLVLSASGFFDLEEMLYRVRVPMGIAQQQSSPSGCLIESNFLLSRSVDVLGCAGSLASLDFGEQCGLDTTAVADLAKEALRYNANKRITEEKQELRQDLKDRLRERLGDDKDPEKEKDNSTRQLLRDLLNR